MSIDSISGSIPDFSALRERLQERISEKINGADTDGSGGLSIEEFSQLAENRPVNPAKSADKPSIEEIFARLDADQSGEITKAEFKSAAEQAKPFGQFSGNLAAVLLSAQEKGEQVETTDLLGQLLDAIGNHTEEDEKSIL